MDDEDDAMNAAKAALAPHRPAAAWLLDSDEDELITIEHEPGSPTVTIHVVENNTNGSRQSRTVVFADNAPRFSVADFDKFGDNLPLEPAVITGCCDDWPAFASASRHWSLESLAHRLPATTRVSLDGGPSFARMSLHSSRVTMTDYQRYAQHAATRDSAPLYLFDPDVLQSSFANGAKVGDDYAIPACFQHDAMAGLNGSRFRPLPPAWLLVGVPRSGTPMHDHPLFVAWNALLSGCKLWCCLPPDVVDESVLQLFVDSTSSHDAEEENHEDDEDFEFDTSALQWFAHCHDTLLPPSAVMIVQQPGEVAYVPPTWWHVVLNIRTSTAICASMTLRRDVPRLFPPLLEHDEDFARAWLASLEKDQQNESSSLLLDMDVNVIQALQQQLENQT